VAATSTNNNLSVSSGTTLFVGGVFTPAATSDKLVTTVGLVDSYGTSIMQQAGCLFVRFTLNYAMAVDSAVCSLVPNAVNNLGFGLYVRASGNLETSCGYTADGYTYNSLFVAGNSYDVCVSKTIAGDIQVWINSVLKTASSGTITNKMIYLDANRLCVGQFTYGNIYTCNAGIGNAISNFMVFWSPGHDLTPPEVMSSYTSTKPGITLTGGLTLSDTFTVTGGPPAIIYGNVPCLQSAFMVVRRNATQSVGSVSTTAIIWDMVERSSNSMNLTYNLSSGLFTNSGTVDCWHKIDAAILVQSSGQTLQQAWLQLDTNLVTAALFSSVNTQDTNYLSAYRTLKLTGIFKLSASGTFSIKLTINGTSPSIMAHASANRLSIERIA